MINSYGRIRSKTTGLKTVVETCPLSEEHANMSVSPTSYFGLNGQVTTHSRIDSIVYTTRSKTFPSRANMCRHSSISTDYGGSVKTPIRIEYHNGGINNFYQIYSDHMDSAGAHPAAIGVAKSAFGVSLDFDVLASGGQAFINDAATRLRPDLTTLSVPNFMLDIGQITKLVSLWKRSMSLAKNLAGAHLNYKFGWKPTIGDLRGMVESITGFQEKLAAFDRLAGKLQTGRAKLLSEGSNRSGSFLHTTDRTCHWSATLTRKVTGHLVWKCLPIAELSANTRILKSLLDSLGFELNPRIVWDAIPLSFVVDWFFGVGKWLETWKIDTMELPIAYVDSYLQYSQELTIESFTTWDGRYAGFNPTTTSGGWVTRTNTFQRMPLFPDYATLSGLGWRMPTFGQATLLVSLITILRKT